MKKTAILIFLISFGFAFGQKTWTLRECVDYAIEKNLTVNQSRIQENLTETELKNAGNQWLPTVSGYLDNSLTLGTNNPSINKGYIQYGNGLGVNSSITIYQGGLLKLNEEKAELNKESARLHTTKTIDDISLMVVNYYLNVMLNRELLEIAQGNQAISEQQLDRTQKLFDGDRVARADLVQAEAELAQRKKDTADAEIEVERALFNLASLLQLPDYREFDVETIRLPDELSLQLYDLEQVLQTAYAQQPAVKRAETEMQIAQKDIEIAEIGFKPKVTGTYNLGTNYSYFFNKGLIHDAWLNQWYDNLTNVFGVSVSFPIFEKHNNKINVERAEINKSLAQNIIEQEKQTIKENVQMAYFDSNSAFKAYEAAKESVRSNEISVDFAQRSFDAGVLNLYDLNIARNNLIAAKAQLAQAKYNYAFRMKVLDFYAGIPLTVGLE
ncbi:MAG: TolC family protein [Weeksellaceae bacterium]